MKRELIIGCLAMGMFSSCSTQMGQNETTSASPRAPEIRTAMERSVIPEVDLENMKPEDALKLWDQASQKYHPLHFKFRHVYSYPVTYTVQSANQGGIRNSPAFAPTHLVTVRRKNISSKRLLDEICHQANLSWMVTGRVITIKPLPADSVGQR